MGDTQKMKEKMNSGQQFPLDLHAGKTGLRNNRTGKLLYSSCVWTAELWVILHVQAPKPKGDKYKASVVSCFEAALRLVFCFFFSLTTCRYLKSSLLLTVVPHLSAPSLSSVVCLSGSIAIIVPLVLLVILIVVVVTGVYVCRRRQR